MHLRRREAYDWREKMPPLTTVDMMKEQRQPEGGKVFPPAETRLHPKETLLLQGRRGPVIPFLYPGRVRAFTFLIPAQLCLPGAITGLWRTE